MSVVSMMSVALLGAILANLSGGKSSSRFVVIGIGVIVAAGWVLPNILIWWQFWKIDWLPDVIAWRRSQRLCGACRYPMAHAADPDGCTVCPECGAAWRLPPPPANNPE
ncbi:MAG: hypothetical protein K2Y21_07570 [Phycisphaerales bacterium]|nr:hypothetical protein [Phycisphaerales bacterium]